MKVKDLSPKFSMSPASAELQYQPAPGEYPIGGVMGGAQFFSNSFKRGAGNDIFGLDENGLFLGAAEWADAPFRVNYQGLFHIGDANNYLDWNGSTLVIKGNLTVNQGGANLIPGPYSNFEYFGDGGAIGAVTRGTSVGSTSGTSYDGARSLKLTATSTDCFVYLGSSATDYNISVKGSTTYIFSAYIKASSGTPTVNFYLKENDGTANSLGTFTVTTTWTRYYKTFTTQSGTTSMLARIDNDVNGDIIYIDCVQVEESISGATEPGKFATSYGGGEVNADKINAGTITGRTLQTAASGQRVVIDGAANTLKFFNSSDLETMRMDSSDLYLMSSGAQSPYGQGILYFRTYDSVFSNLGSIKSEYAIASGDWTGYNTLDITCTTGAGAIRLTGDRVWMSGKVGINSIENNNLTTGLTINQGSADDEILAFKSSDVAHGMTGVTETDTFGYVYKHSATAGGWRLEGLSESNVAIVLGGHVTTEITTKSTSALGALTFYGDTKSGTSVTNMGANTNIAVFRNGSETEFILDADGDSHQNVGTAWTNFDDFEDIELLSALSAGVSSEGDPVRDGFIHLLEENREVLQSNKLVTFNKNGHHFINWSRTNMLMIGAIRQLGKKYQENNLENELIKSRLDLVEKTLNDSLNRLEEN